MNLQAYVRNYCCGSGHSLAVELGNQLARSFPAGTRTASLHNLRFTACLCMHIFINLLTNLIQTVISNVETTWRRIRMPTYTELRQSHSRLSIIQRMSTPANIMPHIQHERHFPRTLRQLLNDEFGSMWHIWNISAACKIGRRLNDWL